MLHITIPEDHPHFAAVVALLAGGSVTSDAKAPAAKNAAAAAKPAAKPAEKTAEERSGGIAYETISAKVLEVSKTKGRDAAVNLLGEFTQPNGEKCTKGKEIEPEDYATFIEKADAVLAEGDLG
jgi:hypothetical protein